MPGSWKEVKNECYCISSAEIVTLHNSVTNDTRKNGSAGVGIDC